MNPPSHNPAEPTHRVSPEKCQTEGTLMLWGIILHRTALVLVLGFILIKAALQFFPHYDTLAYHLPAALHKWNRTTYTPEPILVDVIMGMPPLAHWVEGAIICLTGRMSTSNLINPLSLLMALVVFRWLFPGQGHTRWLATLFLAVPLLLIHCLTSYIDLWSGSLLFIGFICLASLQKGSALPAMPRRRQFWVFLTGLTGLAAAFNSKFQMWPFVVLLSVWIIPTALGLLRNAVMGKGTLAAVLVAWALITAYTPLRNYQQFGNPTFPIANPVFKGHSARTQGVDLSNQELVRQQIPRYLWDAPQFQRFAESVLEINRLQPSDEEMRWSIDQGGGKLQFDSPHHRMGGWFWLTSLLLVGGTIHAAWRRAIPPAAWQMLLLCLLLASVCPQSHELRYWLFLPMTTAAFTVLGLTHLPIRAGMAVKLLAGLTCLHVCITVLAPFEIHPLPPMAYAPAQARAYWRTREASPSNSVLMLQQVKPFGIFWSGPDFNSYRVRDLGSQPEK